MTTDAESETTITEDEINAAILTEEDLRQRSQKLDEVQERWENLAYLATEKIPCPECGGNGMVSGWTCPGCMGSRVQQDPGSDGHGLEMPPFAQLREALSSYGNALADRGLPAGHLAKRNLALPAAASVPTLEHLTELEAQAKSKARELKQLTGGAPQGHGIDVRQLPPASEERSISDETDLGDISDAELADMEDAANMPKDGPRRRK